MTITLEPLRLDHVGEAAALLAARHTRDRLAVPLLPASYEDPAATESLVAALLADTGVEGVVAIRDGCVCGYLAGIPIPDAPEQAFAGFTKPGSVDIPLAGYALAEDQPPALVRRLYSELAQSWVARGLCTHCVTAPASGGWAEFWADLEMGRLLALGARPTAVEAPHRLPPPGITIRGAQPADRDALEHATVTFFRSFADPPLFVPYLEAGSASQRAHIAMGMEDHAAPIWVAVDADGELQGFVLCYEPTSPHWVAAPMESPERALYIEFAYTAPESRGSGLGTAMLDHVLAWAREAGYETLMAHWVTASRASDFWQRHGFRPITHWLRRSVDPRASLPRS